MNWETNSEHQLRYKLQEHEFAFSEEAWQRMSQLLATEPTTPGQAQTDTPSATPDADQKSKNHWIIPLWLLFLALTSTILSLTLLSNPKTLPLNNPKATITSPLPEQKKISPEESTAIKIPPLNTIDHSTPFFTDKPNKTTNNLTPVPLALATDQNNRSSSESPTQPGASTAIYHAKTAVVEPPISVRPTTSLDLLPSKDHLTEISPPVTITWKKPLDKESIWEMQSFVFGGLANHFRKGTQSSDAIRPFIGLGLEWQAPSWGFGVSAQVQPRTGEAWQSQFARNEATPLGYNSIVTEVTTKEIAFIQLNNYLFWRVNPRHRLQGGMALAHIRILKETPNIHTSLVTSLDEQMNALLIKSNQPGIRAWDLGATIGYQFQCTKHWQIQLLYQQGLFDLTADNWFGNVQNDLRSNLQIQLRYDF